MSIEANLRLAVDQDGVLRDLHCGAIQHHGDLADGGYVVHHLSPHLDVKVLIVAAAAAVRRQDVVAGGGQLEHVPVKGLEVVVAPCTANHVQVRRVHP